MPWSLSEASANIWRGSGLFLRFSASINLLGSSDCNFDISLKHDTCEKSEGGFSYLEFFGQKPLSFFPNSSFIALKHHLSETYLDV